MMNTSIKYQLSMLSRSTDIKGVPKCPYLLTKFALRVYGMTSYISSRWNVISFFFSDIHISCSIRKFYGAVINHKGCFVFSPMPNDSLIRLIDKLFCSLNREDLTPWSNGSQRNTADSEKHFRCTHRKYTLLGVRCGRVEWTRK